VWVCNEEDLNYRYLACVYLLTETGRGNIRLVYVFYEEGSNYLALCVYQWLKAEGEGEVRVGLLHCRDSEVSFLCVQHYSLLSLRRTIRITNT
jgi:hypothetical protein